MVYCGKPSKSCRQCRTRDIKCDKRAPACSQCTRAHLACPGYVDTSSLLIRNQTASTIQKAQTKEKGRLAASSRPIFLCEPTRPLLVSVENRAKEIFVKHYVADAASDFPFMRAFYLGRPYQLHLGFTVRAVSLAHFSTLHYSPEIVRRARRRYTTALHLTNAALSCPQKLNDNATLLTVLLLDLFEGLTNTLPQHLVSDGPANEESGHGLGKHIDGALALVKLGGRAQFIDPLRVQMFRQVAVKILLRCVQNGDEVPPTLLALRKFIDEDDPDWTVVDGLIRFIIMRNSVNASGTVEDEAAARVKEREGALVAQLKERESRWNFEEMIREFVSHEDAVAALDLDCATIHEEII